MAVGRISGTDFAFAPRPVKPMQPPPSGFDNSGGKFTFGGFVPNKQKLIVPPDQAPYRHGQSPAQQRTGALASTGEVNVVDNGPNAGAAQRAAQTMAIQRLLNSKGANLTVDGQWGPNTESAYQAFLSHSAQAATAAQSADASRNPLYQAGPPSPDEALLLQQEAARRAQPEATIAYPPTGPEISLTPYFQGQQPFTHNARGDAVYRRPDLNAPPQPTEADLIWMAANKAAPELSQGPKLNPAFKAVVEGIGGALPGVGLAKHYEDSGHITTGNILGEAANDLLWLGPNELKAPFKIVDNVVKYGRAGGETGADLKTVARGAVALWRDKRLARIQNPIIQRDIASSPDRASFISALDQAPNLSGTEKHALVQVADHNAITRAAQTGEKPSIAWGKANFGQSTFHDISPTRPQAEVILAQESGTHFQEQPLTSFARENTWNEPALLRRSARDAVFSVGGFNDVHVQVPFVSKLHALVYDMPAKVGVQELLGKMKSAGIKQDEIVWNKFDTFLSDATAKGQKSISREEALSWLDQHYLKIEENRRAGNQGLLDRPNSDATKFGQYTIAGGREANYQEFTIRLPEDQYGNLYTHSGHFPDANILAHVRTTDRTVANDKTLMIEEIQSDWHQAGQRQGYRVPVTEHPEYKPIVERNHQASLDVNAITSTTRRRIFDALLPHEDQTVHPLGSEPEQALGVDLEERPDIVQTVRWMNRIDQLAEMAGTRELHAEVVPRHDTISYSHSQHGTEAWGVEMLLDGVQVGDAQTMLDDAYRARPHDFGTFTGSYGQDPAELKAKASEQAHWLNNYISMRPADRASVKSGLEALNSALNTWYDATEQLRRLERTSRTGIAQGPFAKTWHELAFKRMLAEAVDRGYERIAWTTGATQAERYNLARFFKKIEIEPGVSENMDELYLWAEERAHWSVQEMTPEDLGFNSEVEQELRDEAAQEVNYPDEEDYYVVDTPAGEIQSHPDAEGAYLNESSYNDAVDEYSTEVDHAYDHLYQQWKDQARADMQDSEIDHYYYNAHEYDDAPTGGSLEVRAFDHQGAMHSYDASEEPTADNYLGNVVGQDLADRYLDGGETVFEGDNLMAGENTKSALGAAHFYDNKLTGFVNKYLKHTGVQSSMDQIVGPKIEYKVEESESGHGDLYPDHRFVVERHVQGKEPDIISLHPDRASAEADAQRLQDAIANTGFEGHGTVVHSIPVTDEVRKFVDQGIVLFQKDPLVKEIAKAQALAPRMKGAVQLGEKANLHLFSSADVSTVVHEMGHVVQQNIPELAGLDPEQFARSFERYFMTAKAPTENLVLPFAEIDTAMRRVYGFPSKIPGAKLTPKMKTALDQFFKTAEKDHPDLFQSLVAMQFQSETPGNPSSREQTRALLARSARVNELTQKIALRKTQTTNPVDSYLLDLERKLRETQGIDRPLYQSDAPGFHEDAQNELEAHAALARDVGRTLPKDQWPAWVRNQLRDQGLLHEDGSFNSAAYFIKHHEESDKPMPVPTSKEEAAKWIDEMQRRNRSPVDPLNPHLSANTPDTFPEDWLFQEGPQEPLPPVEGELAPGEEPPIETPEQVLRKSMRGVASRRGVQNKERSEERARRAEAFGAKLQGGSGIAGYRQALTELRGELPKIDYGGFKELTPEALDHLVNVIRDHQHLMPYQKLRLIEALDKATRGELPTASEQQLIEHVFGKDTARGFKQISGMPAHIQNAIAEVLNVPRSIMASFDLSAPFRQGLVIGARHPRLFFRNFNDMIHAFGSERSYQALMDEVKSRDTYPMMVNAKLAITDMESLDKREEQFYSNLAERIPVAGKGVRASGRAYTGFLVKTRADVFDHLLRVAEAQGIDIQNEDFLSSIGKYINAATGRGDLGVLQHAAPTLNTIFFSPRLLASRLNFLNPVWYARLDPFARQQALQSILRLTGAASTILTLASFAPGVTVNLDPRNADFGKIRIGNTRLDILGGFQQPIRLMSQLASGKIISSTTGDPLVLGPQGPGAVSRRDILMRFFEGKLAPTPSVINDWFKGTNFQGQRFSWKKEAYSHMIPLLAQDSADLYNAHKGLNGIAAAMAGYAVGAFGVGLQTYGPKNPAQKPTSKLQAEAKKAGMPGPTPELLIDVKHQANLDSLGQKHKNDAQGRLDAFIKYYAKETGDHSFDRWIGVKLSDAAAEQGAKNIRAALVGPGLGQYEQAIRASLSAQGKKW